MSALRIDRLFWRASDGKILRRNERWSSVSDACLECGTTEKRHEAFGRCRLCYLKFKRKTDPEWRAKTNRRAKLQAIKHYERVWAYDRERANRPKRREQRRKASRAWVQRNTAKWPVGMTVWHEIAPGAWVTGKVLATNNASALVEFSTCELRVPFKRLAKEKPFEVMEGEV